MSWTSCWDYLTVALCWFNFAAPLEVYPNTSQPAGLFAFVHSDETSEIHGCIKSDFILNTSADLREQNYLYCL